jgi:hypothetical protein
MGIIYARERRKIWIPGGRNPSQVHILETGVPRSRSRISAGASMKWLLIPLREPFLHPSSSVLALITAWTVKHNYGQPFGDRAHIL